MSALIMDLEACRSTGTNMAAAKEQLLQQCSTLLGAINGMVGSTWRSDGANIYQGDFQTWVSKLNQQAEELGNLSNRLNNEINEWEQVASTFG